MNELHQERIKPPSLKIPPPLRGAEAGSFAHDTIVRRLPDIARRTLAENRFTGEVIDRLNALIDELPYAKIRALDDDGPDTETWDNIISRYVDNNWLEVPWFFAETYFYRRILEATGFFQPGPGQGQDPFRLQKRLGLEKSRPQIEELSCQLQDWALTGWNREQFARLLAIDLWGNQLDLSLWPADGKEEPSHGDVRRQSAHLIVDDSEPVFRLLSDHKRPSRVDFLVDNASFELVCDLFLADFLLSTGAAATVTFHLKAHPTFVSDATIADVKSTMEYLASGELSGIRSVATRLDSYRVDDRFCLSQHIYWTSPLAAWEMPADLKRQLRDALLVVSKGDANHRRLLGDRHWEYTTPFKEILAYFPTSLASLRTLKSEVVVGLSTDQVAAMNERDRNWMTDGRWGMIQFAPKQ